MTIPKQETPLKSKLMELAKVTLPGYVFLRHEDVRSSGHPDFTATGYGKTTWWEVKHATPDFTTKWIQERTCLKLAATGYCRYLIYWEYKDFKRTLIIHPRYVQQKEGRTNDMEIEWSCIGHDHRKVLDFIRGIHEANHQRS